MTIDAEMPSEPSTPIPSTPPPVPAQTQEDICKLFGLPPLPPEKKPCIPLESVSLKDFQFQFLKLGRQMHNLMQKCSEDCLNTELVDSIKEVKSTFKGFKMEFKKLPKIYDIHDEQEKIIADLLKDLQKKDEYVTKLIGQPIVKEEPEEIPVAIEVNSKAQKKKKEKQKLNVKGNPNVKNKSKKGIKKSSIKKKAAEEEGISTASKSLPINLPHISLDTVETNSKKILTKGERSTSKISKPNDKRPIEKRLVDPAKIKKLKEKIEEDKKRRAELRKKIAKLQLLKQQSMLDSLKPETAPSKGDPKEQKNSIPKDQPQSSTNQLPQEQQPKDKTLNKDDKKEGESNNSNPPNINMPPVVDVLKEPESPKGPPSPPIIRIMPLPGRILRKPETPPKEIIRFGYHKPKSQQKPPEPSKELNATSSSTVLPKGAKLPEEAEGKANEKSNENQQEKQPKEKLPSTWNELKESFGKAFVEKLTKLQKSKAANSKKPIKPILSVKSALPGQVKKVVKKVEIVLPKKPESAPIRTAKQQEKEKKLKQTLKKLTKIQDAQLQKSEEYKKKKEEERKKKSPEIRDIFQYYEEERENKKSEKQFPKNLRIVKKIVKKPLTKDEQMARKIRRNAIYNAQRNGCYTSPLLTVKYILELQNKIQEAKKADITLTSGDFRKLRHKYFPCKDVEITDTTKKHVTDNEKALSKNDLVMLHKVSTINIPSDSIEKEIPTPSTSFIKPRIITDVSMRLPRRDFKDNELDECIYKEFANVMGT